MGAELALDEKRHHALARVARRRKVPVRKLLERAVDEFIERLEDEELLASSSQIARAIGLREKDAATVVREWRKTRRR